MREEGEEKEKEWGRGGVEGEAAAAVRKAAAREWEVAKSERRKAVSSAVREERDMVWGEREGE